MAEQQPPSQPPSGPPSGGPPAGYGYQQPGAGYYQQPGYYAAQRPGNGIAIAGMVCGILSIIFCWIFYIGIPLGILGFVFGFIGRGRAERGASLKGVAVAGIVCGIIGTVLSVLIIVLLAVAIHNAVTTPGFTFAPAPT